MLTALALVVIAAFLLGKLITLGTAGNTQNNPNSQNNPKLSGPAPTNNTVITPTTIPTPTPTATPSPTPSPTPCPNPCVLYQAGGSNGWDGWSYPSTWRVVSDGLLLGDAFGGKPAAVAPFTLPDGITHFAVEAVIAVPEDITIQGNGFGVTACGSSQSGGWQGYSGGITTGLYHLSGFLDRSAAVDRTNDQVGGGNYDPGTTFHRYQLEIKGNLLTLKIDGAPVVLNATDDRYQTCGQQVGLFNSVANIIQIKSFEVISLS